MEGATLITFNGAPPGVLSAEGADVVFRDNEDEIVRFGKTVTELYGGGQLAVEGPPINDDPLDWIDFGFQTTRTHAERVFRVTADVSGPGGGVMGPQNTTATTPPYETNAGVTLVGNVQTIPATAPNWVTWGNTAVRGTGTTMIIREAGVYAVDVYLSKALNQDTGLGGFLSGFVQTMGVAAVYPFPTTGEPNTAWTKSTNARWDEKGSDFELIGWDETRNNRYGYTLGVSATQYMGVNWTLKIMMTGLTANAPATLTQSAYIRLTQLSREPVVRD